MITIITAQAVCVLSGAGLMSEQAQVINLYSAEVIILAPRSDHLKRLSVSTH